MLLKMQARLQNPSLETPQPQILPKLKIPWHKPHTPHSTLEGNDLNHLCLLVSWITLPWFNQRIKPDLVSDHLVLCCTTSAVVQPTTWI
jgi:hypothetical protein